MRFGLCGKADAWDLAERLGFDYLELPLNWVAPMDEESFQDLLRESGRHRVKAERMNLLYPKTMNLFAVDPDEEKAYLEKGFSRMWQLGSTLVVFGSGKSRRVPEGMPLGDALVILRDHTRIACDMARTYGITIALEPLNRAETNVLHTVAEGAYFAALVDEPNFGVLADMYHMTRENEDWDDITLVGKLAHAHIATRATRGYPVDAADPDVAAFMGQLKAIGYQGDLSIEGKTEDAGRDGKAALAVLRQCNG